LLPAVRRLAWIASALASCGGASDLHFATSYWFDGTEHYSTAHEADAQLAEALVRDQAARDLNCAKVNFALTQPYDRAWVVNGCGKRAVFVVTTVSLSDLATIPGHGGAYLIQYERAIDVTAEHEPAPAPGQQGSAYTGEIRRWRTLVEESSKDLTCPVTEILPDMVPQGRAPMLPIAEGCGQRASYVVDGERLRLVSQVPIR
jgi:hypothetical protein